MADTVKVGCRLPQGIVLRVSEPGKDAFGEPMMKEIGTFTVAGSGQHVAAPGLMHAPEDEVTFSEVPADLWSKWYAANKDGDLAQGGVVFKEGQDPLEKAAKADVDKDDGASRRARTATADGK